MSNLGNAVLGSRFLGLLGGSLGNDVLGGGFDHRFIGFGDSDGSLDLSFERDGLVGDVGGVGGVGLVQRRLGHRQPFALTVMDRMLIGAIGDIPSAGLTPAAAIRSTMSMPPVTFPKME